MHVFISYRHGATEQQDRVRAFGTRLQEAGIKVELDQFLLDERPGGPNEGWDKWSSDQALTSKRVLIVGTYAWFQCFEKKEGREYGLGAACEADDLRHRIFELRGIMEDIRIVLFDDCEAEHIPAKLKRYHFFHADRDFPKIIRWINLAFLIEAPIPRDEAGKGSCPSAVPQLASNFIATALSIYRGNHKLRYEKLIAGRQLLPITAYDSIGGVADASSLILSWIDSPKTQDIAVLGDPGSGKTYLLRRTCAVLSDRVDVMPIFLSAGHVAGKNITTWPQLLALADPPATYDLCASKKLILVIDGLDELIEFISKDQTKFLGVLSMIGRLMPAGVRLIFSCRSTAFEATSDALLLALNTHRSTMRLTEDITDDAIYMALRNDASLGVRKLELLEIPAVVSRNYLRDCGVMEIDGDPTIDYMLANMPRLPVILRFLQLAMPELRAARGRVELDELYRAAIRALILRDPLFRSADVDKIWLLLVEIARENGSPSKDDVSRLVQVGLLLGSKNNEYEWAHASIHEFFYSISLFSEIRKFDAHTLARLDLIGLYNINRFLIPQCRRALSKVSTACNIKIVTQKEFTLFLAETGWRKQVGYGRHPSYIAEDGVGFTSATLGLRPEHYAKPIMKGTQDSVKGISWFDAFAYCLWSGDRLPITREVEDGFSAPEGFWIWCDDWINEPKAHIAVATPIANGAKFAGVNPDFRHSNIGFATIRR